ncbi:hypothetical protein [Streptomyces spinosisporus]|uniref:Uncharacterized protein n=1 Tax=Streptomyces spinosisporus TaxID=2927582 RepID=A0ABS9XF93_9ACTN|nr:hypothetical protein [Streptomyces spinosisporus]MCI3240292.1 hypothetical protein [Streptomyces spinosisporus]
MARKFTTGFEAGTEWDTTNGSPTIVTTQANSGTHSLRCHPTTSQQTSISQEIDPDGNRDHVFLRAYINVATAPAAMTGIMAWSGESTDVSDFYGVKMTASRTLIITASGSTTGGTATAAIPLNTWTRVEFDYDDPNGTGKIYIDGTLATTRTGIALEGGVYARFGVINPTTADIYFDDIAVNDSTGSSDNGLPGPVATDQEVTLGTARETSAARPITRYVPNLSTIVDNFNDGTINEDLWTDSYNTGRISETGGRARVTCGTDYNAFAVGSTYTLTGSTFHVQVFPSPAGGGTLEAWSQVLVTSATPGTDLVMEVDAIADELNMALRVDYFDPDAVRIPYDPEAHAWFRIREDAGTLYWETAPDGETWTQRRTATTPTWAAADDNALQLISHRDTGADTITEFDNVNTLPTGQEVFPGTAHEASAARGLAVGKASPLGAAAVTDAGGSLTAAKSTTLGTAQVADEARPLTVSRAATLGAAQETATAQTLTATVVVPLGLAQETSTSGPLTVARTATLGPGREEAAGRPLTASKHTVLGVAREVSAAGAVGHARTALVGAAADTDTALPLTAGHTVATGPAGSVDSAQPITAAKTMRLGTARSPEQAGAVATAGETRISAAASRETGRPLTGSKASTLTAAAAQDLAGPLAGGKAGRLSAAATVDSARALAGGKARTVAGARERAHAGALTGAKRIVLGTAREQAAAEVLGVVTSGGLGFARAIEGARPLTAAKAVTLGPARAAEIAQPLEAGHRIPLGRARAVERARDLAAGKTVRLGPARCSEQATALTISGHTTLGAAREVAAAGRVRQPFQIRRLRTAHAVARATAWDAQKQRPADELLPSVSGPVLTPSTSGPVLTATVTGPSLHATSTQGG